MRELFKSEKSEHPFWLPFLVDKDYLNYEHVKEANSWRAQSSGSRKYYTFAMVSISSCIYKFFFSFLLFSCFPSASSFFLSSALPFFPFRFFCSLLLVFSSFSLARCPFSTSFIFLFIFLLLLHRYFIFLLFVLLFLPFHATYTLNVLHARELSVRLHLLLEVESMVKSEERTLTRTFI